MANTSQSPLSDVQEAPTPGPVTMQEFKNFVCTKAFDIIAEGKYRKYLVRCKDSNDEWAVSVQASINKVHNNIKQIVQTLDIMEQTQSGILIKVCREVTMNATPPTKVRDGYSVCSLTGVQAENCIDLSKSTQKGVSNNGSSSSSAQSSSIINPATFSETFFTAPKQSAAKNTKPPPSQPPAKQAKTQHPPRPKNQSASQAAFPSSSPFNPNTVMLRMDCETLVHPRFSHFFLLLWYTTKIEHIVRNHTRCWLDQLQHNKHTIGDPSQDNTTVQALCELFSQQENVFEDMCAVFNHGVMHVLESLRDYSNGIY